MTATYFDIVHTLTHHCPVLTAEQIGRYWHPHTVAPEKIALQLLRRQARKGLLKLDHSMIHPPLKIHEPLIDWRPGISIEPQWESVAWKVQSRWNQNPVRAVIVSATKEARTLTGGPLCGRPTRPLELSHDVTLAEIFLSLRQRDAKAASHWLPDDVLTGYGEGDKKPDAVIGHGDAGIVIELGGKAYSAKRLNAIHDAHRHRHYQLH
jgi:hypothetical protein